MLFFGHHEIKSEFDYEQIKSMTGICLIYSVTDLKLDQKYIFK